MTDEQTLTDYQNRRIRLPQERWQHILEHAEMVGQLDRIIETLTSPELVIATEADPAVHAYHRLYPQTPVTRKYLIVAVKVLPDDAFVLTAFFSRRLKKGSVLWQP
ncbi:MAG: hypothetical protein IT324_02695 [Anaerolineae bacterium]|nr:hypothetical protein [Anaerolineae bacterium]